MDDRGPQRAREKMKTQHMGLFYWEVMVLVTARPKIKY